MTWLAEFNERHPTALGVVGTASGIGAGIIEHINLITGIVGLIGTCAGTAVAVMTFTVKASSRIRSYRRRMIRLRLARLKAGR